MASRYRMLAIDLDGTLLDERGEVPGANADALKRARDAGLAVLICTGRGYIESERVFRAIGQIDPVIVAGGAVTADPTTGRTIHRDAMDDALVGELTDAILGTGHAALLLKDRSETGYDYLVATGRGRVEPDPVTVWWFEKMGVSVRFAASLDEDGHAGHTVRVGVLGDEAEADRAHGLLAERFSSRVAMQAFSIVVGPEVTGAGDRRIKIAEAFDPDAGKWPAVLRVARGLGVEPAQIAAIGDELNDLEMVREAGLGIAMENARDEVLEAAARVTGHHANAGVSDAVDRILEGVW